MRSLVSLLVLSCVTANPAVASTYWVAYEGNDYPENEGWERTFTDPNGIVGQGGAIRTLQDGNLIIDSREDVSIVDFYVMERPVDPAPGETFVMRWRLRVDEVPSSFPYDLGVVVASQAFGAVAFQLGEDGLRSLFETRERIPYAAGVFHSFEFISSNMVTYDLFMDGALFLSGAFDPVVNSHSGVQWGDDVQGGRSKSTWDRIEFGVIPEPPGSLLVTILLTVLTQRCRFASILAAMGG